MAQTLSTVGLLMAGATSISNVVKDISAKKVVDHHELIASTFWIRLFAAIHAGLLFRRPHVGIASDSVFPLMSMHVCLLFLCAEPQFARPQTGRTDRRGRCAVIAARPEG